MKHKEEKAEKPICPKCGKKMRLLSTGYSLETYTCRDCKTNMQIDIKKEKV